MTTTAIALTQISQLARCVWDMTFYFRGDGDFEQDILNFHAAALECLKEKVRYYLVDMEGRFKKANKNTPGLLPRFVEEKKGYYNLILETGAKSGSFTDRAIQINVMEGGNGYARLILPAEFITVRWCRFRGPRGLLV